MNYKFYIVFFFGIISFSKLYSQNSTLVATYSVEDIYYDLSDEPVKGILTNCNNESNFIIYKKALDPNTTYIDDNGKVKGDLMDFQKVYYKNFNDNFILSKTQIRYSGQSTMIDSLKNLYTWKITNNKKEILGYNCIEAQTTFRGRDYIVYYTPEITVLMVRGNLPTCQD